jgi:hypothetical protein
MFAGPVGNAPPLDGPRLDLGACPACGSTQSLAASRGPDGRLRVRCRDCGLVGNPPDEGALARRSSRPTDHRSMAAPDCVRTVPHTSHPNIGMGKALLTAVAASVALVGWGGMILAAYFLAQLGKGWGGAS